MNAHKEGSSGRKKSQATTLKFQDMAKKINVYLKEENLNLNFRGYTETVMRYFRVQDHDLYELHQLMIECNLWNNYMADVENFVQAKALELQLEADRLSAFINKKAPHDFVEQDITDVKTKAKEFAIFYKQLIAQKMFFEKGFWHCYNLYGKGINTLKYKTVD